MTVNLWVIAYIIWAVSIFCSSKKIFQLLIRRKNIYEPYVTPAQIFQCFKYEHDNRMELKYKKVSSKVANHSFSEFKLLSYFIPFYLLRFSFFFFAQIAYQSFTILKSFHEPHPTPPRDFCLQHCQIPRSAADFNPLC